MTAIAIAAYVTSTGRPPAGVDVTVVTPPGMVVVIVLAGMVLVIVVV